MFNASNAEPWRRESSQVHCPRPPDPPQGPCPGGPAGGDFPIGDRGLLPVNEDRCETYIYNIHIYNNNSNNNIYII